MIPTTSLHINADELGRLISQYVEVGYGMAVKSYSPTSDSLRKTEVESWLSATSKDIKLFHRLLRSGRIKPFKKGNSSNSPFYFSKSDILTAFAEASVNQLHTDNFLANM